MSFKPDPNKRAQEAIFSSKLNKSNHPSLNFTNTIGTQSTTHKHLGMILDAKLNFQNHFKYELIKRAGVLRLHKILTRPPLLTIYKSLTRSYLDYGNIIYGKAYNVSFHQNLGIIQYNTALAIRGAVIETSKEKLYQELGLESLEKTRWYQKVWRSLTDNLKYLRNITPENKLRQTNFNEKTTFSLWKLGQYYGPKCVIYIWKGFQSQKRFITQFMLQHITILL